MCPPFPHWPHRLLSQSTEDLSYCQSTEETINQSLIPRNNPSGFSYQRRLVELLSQTSYCFTHHQDEMFQNGKKVLSHAMHGFECGWNHITWLIIIIIFIIIIIITWTPLPVHPCLQTHLWCSWLAPNLTSNSQSAWNYNAFERNDDHKAQYHHFGKQFKNNAIFFKALLLLDCHSCLSWDSLRELLCSRTRPLDP